MRSRGIVLAGEAFSAPYQLLRPMTPLKEFDTVALLEDIPAMRLVRGQVGTIVQKLAPDAYEVEFADEQGRTYASLGLQASQLLLLHTHLVEVA